MSSLHCVSKKETETGSAKVSRWLFHVDMGRKYFSLQELKDMVAVLAREGFSGIELAFGNDGLRLVLDSYEVSACGQTYSTEQIAAGIAAGNKGYYDAGEKNELSQAEMDELLAYCGEQGIEVVPLFNCPGHADAVLGVLDYLGVTDNAFEGSKTTLNLKNSKATAFAKNLIQNYIDYFAAKGCKIFNIGGDEYANDIFCTGEMGFGQLIRRGEYSLYVDFLNDMAARIKKAGMEPMAFNDGIYFRENTSGGVVDPDITVSYWTIGWDEYRPASADFIAAKGHKIINTRNEWYYVLGQTPGKQFCIENAKKLPAEYAAGDVFGTDAEAIAAMQCLWCDFPYKPYNKEEAANVAEIIHRFAEANR